jgi:hypothetical protein
LDKGVTAESALYQLSAIIEQVRNEFIRVDTLVHDGKPTGLLRKEQIKTQCLEEMKNRAVSPVQWQASQEALFHVKSCTYSCVMVMCSNSLTKAIDLDAPDDIVDYKLQLFNRSKFPGFNSGNGNFLETLKRTILLFKQAYYESLKVTCIL